MKKLNFKSLISESESGGQINGLQGVPSEAGFYSWDGSKFVKISESE